jgi:hypothetical protein
VPVPPSSSPSCGHHFIDFSYVTFLRPSLPREAPSWWLRNFYRDGSVGFNCQERWENLQTCVLLKFRKYDQAKVRSVLAFTTLPRAVQCKQQPMLTRRHTCGFVVLFVATVCGRCRRGSCVTFANSERGRRVRTCGTSDRGLPPTSRSSTIRPTSLDHHERCRPPLLAPSCSALPTTPSTQDPCHRICLVSAPCHTSLRETCFIVTTKLNRPCGLTLVNTSSVRCVLSLLLPLPSVVVGHTFKLGVPAGALREISPARPRPRMMAARANDRPAHPPLI